MPTKAKLQMRDNRTGLLIGPDSRLIIRSSKDAKKAVETAGEIMAEINEIRTTQKLGMLEAEYENLRKSLRDFQVDSGVDEVTTGTYVSTLVKRKKSFWVWALEDIPENIALEDDIVPLKDVFKRKIRDFKKRTKLINQVTHRVVVPAALDDVVRQGLLSAEDVEGSFAEYIDANYIQIKEQAKK